MTPFVCVTQFARVTVNVLRFLGSREFNMGNRKYRQMHNRKNKKEKFVLKFDENARREFLTGFHKRNLQKKEKAAEKLKKKLILERKRVKAQTKTFYKNLIKSQKPVSEISHLLTENIDLGEHCVSVTEISPVAAAKECSWIGQNQVCYENNDVNENEEENQADGDEEDISGMEILPKAKNSSKMNNLSVKTTKDFKKIIKKQATDAVKQSKVYRTKSKVAQIKNTKRKRIEEWRRRKENKRRQRAGSED